MSAAHTEGVELCERVLPHLVAARASFKLPRDLDSLFAINSGRAGATQVGKILTVYESLESDLGELAGLLLRLWPTTDGPRVPSDLRITGGEAVFARYGAISARRVIVDRLGRHAFVLRRPDGVDVPDRRSTDGSQPEWAPPAPVECDPPSEIDLDYRFDIAGEEFLPMVFLSGSMRGKTYLGISLEDGRSVVLKTAAPGVCWDITGFDSVDLLHREYEVLLEISRDTDLAPRPIGFDRSDLAVLAIEDMRGDALEDTPRAALIGLLPHLAQAVADLHAYGYVHRDVKLSNAVAVGESVRLVDFGLATRIGHRDISGGTRNYMAPEGTDRPAAPAEDVFALGVAVAHAFLGRDPAMFPAPPWRLLGLLDLQGAEKIASILKSALSRDPTKRPTATELAGRLGDVAARSSGAALERTSRGSRSTRLSTSRRNWCMRASLSTGAATRQFFEQEAGGGWWRNGHFESGFACEGVNLGAAGVVLGLMSLDHGLRRNDFEDDVAQGCSWLGARPSSETALGLLSGDAGVALALAVAGRRYGRSDWIAAAKARMQNAASVQGDYDLFSGVAGVLYAASIISAVVEDQWPNAIGRRLADQLFATAQVANGMLVWPSFDDTEAPLTGAAHGCSGVALALAEWGKRSGDAHSRYLAVDVFSRLFDNGRLANGGLVRSLEDNAPPTEDQLWCHGAAGYIWCLLVSLGDEPLLREALDWGAERFFSSAVLTSPVYCHGLAGQLDLCAILGAIARFRPQAEQRATRAAGTLRLLMERRDGLSVWMSEEPETITPDLWVGFLGPAVALAAYASGSDVSIFSPEWLVACSHPVSDES